MQKPTRQDRLFQAIGIINKGMNSKLKKIMKTALNLGPNCNYIMLQLTQKEKLTCPKLYIKKPRLVRGDVARVFA